MVNETDTLDGLRISVVTHLRHAMRKIGAHDRIEAARMRGRLLAP